MCMSRLEGKYPKQSLRETQNINRVDCSVVFPTQMPDQINYHANWIHAHHFNSQQRNTDFFPHQS